MAPLYIGLTTQTFSLIISPATQTFSPHSDSIRLAPRTNAPRWAFGILNFTLRERMTRSTIVVIAERVGVSPATVSRALNNLPGVSTEKRRRIIEVAEELQYHPNVIARSLQGQRTNIVAYVADVSNRPA